MNRPKSKSILAASAFIVGAAFILGLVYFNVGIHGLKNFRAPGKYKVHLQPGRYFTYVFYKWKSEGIFSERYSDLVFKVQDESGKEVEKFNYKTDAGTIIAIHEFNGRTGDRLTRFDISKNGWYTIETDSPDLEKYILTIVPLPEKLPLEMKWYIDFELELAKNNFHN